MGLAWPWKKSYALTKKGHIKTMNVFFGFFFLVNYCVGTGFLGIPYAFFSSGYLAAIPTLLFISVINWVNANYLLEVMARAQALEYFEKSQKPPTDSDTTDSELDQKQLTSSFLHGMPSGKDHPRFEITVRRKFEITELCEIFYNKYLKYTYIILLSIFVFLATWSFSTVAGSAWAINIPFHNFGAAEECTEDSFFHKILPSGGCLYSYYLSLTIFGIIVVTLSLFDLKEQAIFQLLLGLLRFVTVAAMVLYCIVHLAMGGDACLDQMNLHNATTPINVGRTFTVLRFNPRGWLVSIPVFTFAFLFHVSISSLTHPIKQKGSLHWLLMAMFVASTLCYMSLGVVVPLWFGASTQETVTLSWANFARPGNPLPLRLLSYYLVLFPSLDVVSAYPLSTHVSVNNLYILITGHDTSRKPKYKFDWFLRICLRFVVALVPVLAAFGVSNLIYVLKFGGLFGFICFLFPVLLQLKSIYVCKKKFSTFHVSVSGFHSGGKGDSLQEVSTSLEKKPESLLLLAQDMDKEEKRAVYMTPYSNFFLSHPVSVCVVGVIGMCLFLLALSSLFVHSENLTCKMLAT